MEGHRHIEKPDNKPNHDCTERDKLLDEYVLNDVGKIWMGAYGSARGREWVYGQYDDAALPVCVYLLERCGLAHMERGNPVLVTRALTKMVRQSAQHPHSLRRMYRSIPRRRQLKSSCS